MRETMSHMSRRWWRALSDVAHGSAAMLLMTTAGCAPGEDAFPRGTSVAEVHAKLGRPAGEVGSQPGGVEALLALVPGQCQHEAFAGVLYYGYHHTMRHPWLGEDVFVFIDQDSRVRCIAKRKRTAADGAPTSKG